MKHFYSLLSLLLSLYVFTGGLSAAAYEIPKSAAVSVVSESPQPIAAAMPLSSATSSKKSDALPVVDINNETILKYTAIAPKFLENKGSRTPYLYNFNTDMSSGIDSDGDLINTEANYGLTAYVSNQKIAVKAYNYTKTKLTVKAAIVRNMNTNKSSKVKIGYDYKTIDTKNLANGLYGMAVKFSNSKSVALYFYVNGNETKLCNIEYLSTSEAKLYKDRRTALAKVIKNGKITPKNRLDLSDIHYPCYEFNDTYRCDTQRWADLSDTLVKSDWSDEHKLFTIWEWINENIAYDYYIIDLPFSRSYYKNDYSGKYSVYNTHTGVCFDNAHIFIIMCRAQGIPAIIVGSLTDNHVWNAAYINGRWIEFDTTVSSKYAVYTEDTAKRVPSEIGSDFIPYGVFPSGENYAVMPKDAAEYIWDNKYVG